MRRQLIIVSSLTAIAQMLGFLKLWITARLFGVSSELDGYFLALVVPTLISGVLAGLLQTSLFPVRAKLAATQGPLVVARFERGVVLILFVIGVSMAAINFMVAPHLIDWRGDRLPPSVYEAALFVLPFATLLIPLNAIGDGLGYLLALRDRYPIAAAATIANALIGSALLALWPEGGLLNLALGTVIGLALQVAICLIGLTRAKFHIFGSLPARDELGHEWREMARLSAWIFPGIIFANLTATLPTVLIASYGEGAVSAFGYAWRFHQYAIQLLVMSASPVLLSHIATLVAIGDEPKVRRLLVMGFGFALITGVLVTLVVGIWGQSILAVIFQGRFDDVAAAQVSGHWLWLSVALAPALLGNICAKVWQARGLAGLMSLLAGFGLIMFLLAHQFLEGLLESHSVAASVGLSSLAVTLVGWNFAWRPAQKRILPAARSK